MVTYSPLFKVALIYLGISIILYAGGVRFTGVVGEYTNLVTGTNTSGDFLSTGQQYTMGQNVSGIQPNLNSGQNPVGGGLGLIEVLNAVGSAITFLINVAFAIPTLLFSFPGFIGLFIAVPLGIIALIALVFFVRSG